MKHEHSDVNVNVNINIPTGDILTVLDHVADVALELICVSTAAYFLKWSISGKK